MKLPLFCAFGKMKPLQLNCDLLALVLRFCQISYEICKGAINFKESVSLRF